MDDTQDVREIETLKSIVGQQNIKTGPLFSTRLADRIAYSRELLSPVFGEYLPEYVVMPGCVEEVQEVLRTAYEETLPVYTYSRGTNVYCYTLPLRGGILLDLHRMDRILEISQETMTATVEPGVNWGRLRKEALKKNLTIVPILGPYTGGVIGNFTSWNYTPGGTRYSPDRIVTVEVVLANGEILRTGSQALRGHEAANPYYRYAFGPDITGLFRGSVGTLGIITKAVVALYPILDVQKNITYAFQDLRSALDSMQRIEQLDITKHIAIYNRGWAAEMCDPQFKFIDDISKQEEALQRYPDWILNIYVCGKAQQVSCYEELIRNEVVNGREFKFEGKERGYWEDFAQGAGQRVSGMFGSARNAITTLTVTPFSACPRIFEEAMEEIREADFRDPMTGGPYEPTVMYFPCDRGRVVFSEIEYRFDSLNPESMGKAVEIWNDLSRLYIEKLGSSLMLISPLVEDYLMPSYVEVVKAIKNIFDSKGILSPGRIPLISPFSSTAGP